MVSSPLEAQPDSCFSGSVLDAGDGILFFVRIAMVNNVNSQKRTRGSVLS